MTKAIFDICSRCRKYGRFEKRVIVDMRRYFCNSCRAALFSKNKCEDYEKWKLYVYREDK